MAGTDVLQRTVAPLTLKTLALQLQHGRRISQRIRQVSGRSYRSGGHGVPSAPSTGTSRLGPFEVRRIRQQPAGQVVRIDPNLEKSIRGGVQIVVHVVNCSGQHP